MERRYYSATGAPKKLWPNVWDVVAGVGMVLLLMLLADGASQMSTPYALGDALDIRLDVSALPGYGVRSVTRILLALMCSLLFTFTIGTWAANSRRAERIILPLIDMLQSVPVLSFLSMTLVGFIALFPHNLLGPECACIFVIFTAQAWNITLGFYQTLKNLPKDLIEAASMLQLSRWQRFWRIDVPYSMPPLLWNVMMSVSASWFFVVECEAISVANQDIRLPGIGSYIALAIKQSDLTAVGYAILAMLILILLYDQLCFRPLMQWSDKFYLERQKDSVYRSWVMHVLRKTHLISHLGLLFSRITHRLVHHAYFRKTPAPRLAPVVMQRPRHRFWSLLPMMVLLALAYYLWSLVRYDLAWHDLVHTTLLGAVTCMRVVVLIVISSLIWVPLGVLIGLHPRWALHLQPMIQFVASFPANLLFPLAVTVIIHQQLDPEIWLTPLMILGSQWYILFNVIAGTLAVPQELYDAVGVFPLRGWAWWRRFMLPAIFPFYITGAMAAAGGAWNASIVAEWVHWGDTLITATGLGAYIQQHTIAGDFHRIALGTAVMCAYVLLLNWLVWQPMYRLAEKKFRMS